MPHIVTATLARFLSTRTSSRGGSKQLCLLLAWLTIFSQLIGYSPTLFARSKSYTLNNLSGKYFTLVEKQKIKITKQNNDIRYIGKLKKKKEKKKIKQGI